MMKHFVFLVFCIFASLQLHAVDVVSEINTSHPLLAALREHKFVREVGGESQRTAFVSLQGEVERALSRLLANGQLTTVMGIIHTPKPSTPLCVLPDATDLHPTVAIRAHTVREFLDAGGALYVIYPKDGREQRSADELAVYAAELTSHSENLVDWPLDVESMPGEMIGATYFLVDQNETLSIFSIRARQINDTRGVCEWTAWLGEASHPEVCSRMVNVITYLQGVGGPLKFDEPAS